MTAQHVLIIVYVIMCFSAAVAIKALSFVLCIAIRKAIRNRRGTPASPARAALDAKRPVETEASSSPRARSRRGNQLTQVSTSQKWVRR